MLTPRQRIILTILCDNGPRRMPDLLLHTGWQTGEIRKCLGGCVHKGWAIKWFQDSWKITEGGKAALKPLVTKGTER